MDGFVGAEIFHRGFQNRVLAVFQSRDLGGVMFVDHFLDRGGAGKSGFLAQCGGGSAQRETGDAPHRLQRGGPHLAFIDQVIEGFQVALFLLGHVLDGFDAALGAPAAPEHRKLAFIDAHRAILPGMIHPDHGFDVGGGAGRRRLGLAGHARFFTSRAVPMTAAPSEKMAL